MPPTTMTEVPEVADSAVVGVDLPRRMAAPRDRTRLSAADEGRFRRAAALDEREVPVHESSIVGEHERTVTCLRDSSGVTAEHRIAGTGHVGAGSAPTS